MNGFYVMPIKRGLLFDRSDGTFPTRVFGWASGEGLLTLREPSSSYMGYVLDGKTKLRHGEQSYQLTAGQYFSIHDSIEVEGGSGMIVERGQYRTLNLVGGPVESQGRLRYIDGCTDTLLVPPVKRGDACLNALFFPLGVDQTLHTHPSIRVGIVAGGHGECRTEISVEPLLPGHVFLIEEDTVHGFHTEPDAGMVIIAYHPDSDFGPVDEDHPMINRTMVDGVSAADIAEIQTR